MKYGKMALEEIHRKSERLFLYKENNEWKIRTFRSYLY
jgi:hypothetical protein